MSELIGEDITIEYNGVTTTQQITGVSFSPKMWSANGRVERMNVTLVFQDGGSVTITKRKYDDMVDHEK